MAGLASMENSLRVAVDPPCAAFALPAAAHSPSIPPTPTPVASTNADGPTDLPTVDVLVPVTSSLPASPPPSSPSSALTPSSSPTRTPTGPEIDQLGDTQRMPTPTAGNVLLSIPPESPLAGRARLEDTRSGVRVDTDMEWRIYAPDCHLGYVPRDSKDGGSVVYPPKPCKSCLDATAVCSGVGGLKCARCKARHAVCSLYVSPFLHSLRSSSSQPISGRQRRGSSLG